MSKYQRGLLMVLAVVVVAQLVYVPWASTHGGWRPYDWLFGPSDVYSSRVDLIRLGIGMTITGIVFGGAWLFVQKK